MPRVDREEYNAYAGAYRASKRGKEVIAKCESKRTEIRRTYRKEYDANLKKQVLAHYGPICACCGELDIRFLCVHHIHHGRGNPAPRQANGGKGAGSPLYRWLINNNFPEGFQILCWNCNSGKYIYGICPHKLPKPDEIDQKTTGSYQMQMEF